MRVGHSAQAANIVYARADHSREARRARPGTREDKIKQKQRRLPTSGYFAEENPNVEVRPALSFVENPDLQKRPGRYQSDFIWNVDWQSQMDREEAEAAKRKLRSQTPSTEGNESGGLGLARMLDLNRMDIDLSEHLKRRETAPAAAAQLSDQARSEIKPTQAESRRWQRSGRWSTKAAVETLVDDTELMEQAAAERADYEQLKRDLQTWTLAVTIFGISASSVFYSKEVAVSYGIGAVGSFVYLRMLNRSVEGMTGGGLGGALGQPRLLIPIVLALGYNRWNHLKAEETGLVLQLLPMLLGFFTYKAAVVGKQAGTLLSDLAASAAPPSRTQADP